MLLATTTSRNLFLFGPDEIISFELPRAAPCCLYKNLGTWISSAVITMGVRQARDAEGGLQTWAIVMHRLYKISGQLRGVSIKGWKDQETGDETPHAETHYITSCDSQPNGSRTHLREAPGPLHGDAGMVRHNSRGFSLFLSLWSPRNRQHPIQFSSHFSIPGIFCGIP